MFLYRNFGPGISAVSSGIVPEAKNSSRFNFLARKSSIVQDFSLKRHMSDDFSTNDLRATNYSNFNTNSDTTSSTCSSPTPTASSTSPAFHIREQPVWRKENIPKSNSSSNSNHNHNPSSQHKNSNNQMSTTTSVNNRVKLVLFIIKLWNKIINLLPLYGPLFWTWYGYLIDDFYIITPYGIGLCCEIFKKLWQKFMHK